MTDCCSHQPYRATDGTDNKSCHSERRLFRCRTLEPVAPMPTLLVPPHGKQTWCRSLQVTEKHHEGLIISARHRARPPLPIDLAGLRRPGFRSGMRHQRRAVALRAFLQVHRGGSDRANSLRPSGKRFGARLRERCGSHKNPWHHTWPATNQTRRLPCPCGSPIG